MKSIDMLITSWCPHCKRASAWIEEIKSENLDYANIEVNVIDEEAEPEKAKEFDYYYVPTYFVDGIKIHEGATSKDKLLDAFEAASK